MKHFTVETVMAPIRDGDWGGLRKVTDIIPGTILIEDPDEPVLVIPLAVPTQQIAAIFVQGVMTVLGHEIKWGRAYLTEDCDLDYEDRESATVTQLPVGIAPEWLEDEEATRRARDLLPA